MVNFVISTIIILCFVIFGKIGLSINLLWYFIILFVQYLVSIGIALIVSSITVYFRDLLHILGIIIQLLFYATPIVYSVEQVPAKFLWVMKLNPMSYLITCYRDIFYYKTAPSVHNLLIATIMGGILIAIGIVTFKKLEKRFAEEL